MTELTPIIITLISAGVLLILIEFVIPGGIVGALGVILMMGGVALTFSEHGVGPGLLALVGTVTLCVVAIALWMKYIRRTLIGKALSNDDEVGGTDEFAEKEALLGKKGVARTDLRPSGSALIEGQRVDVVAETKLIEKGAPVEVIKAEGLRVIVREIA